MASKTDIQNILERYNKETLQQLCAEATSLSNFARLLGYDTHWNHTIQDLISMLHLDTSHFRVRNNVIADEASVRRACEQNSSLRAVGIALGYHPNSAYRGAKRQIEKYGIDVSHFKKESKTHINSQLGGISEEDKDRI